MAGAQAAKPAPPPAAKPDKPDKIDKSKRKEMRENLRREVIDQMRAERMWRMTEELKLDEATAAKVFPLLAKFDERVREVGKERAEIVGAMTAELAAARFGNATPAPGTTLKQMYKGSLDDIRIYERALTADEVTALHAGTP